MTETSRDTAKAFFACMAARDYDRLWSQFLTDESTWTIVAPSLPSAEPLRGRAIAEFFQGADEAFEAGGPTVEITGTVAEGQFVAIEATGKGRLRNGREYDNRYHFLVEVRDGCILAVREYMDSHMVAETFGE